MRRVVRRNQILAAIGGLSLVLSMSATPADARGHHRHHRHSVRHQAMSSAYSPPFAAMMVDGNSGRVLYARNENELRHPASITKVMTLYMLFDQIEKGRMNLGTEIEMSAHAASMAPSKLGLPAGESLSVETAIKAVVTKSANDVAVAIAEAIGGSEEHFAEMMTAKARSLGMSRTTYVNASGLPDDEQVTTAHDLVVLGRAIQDRFPNYYRYFSTPHFTYHGRQIGNHNHLLGRVEGMDGIKTGYTRDSGFNLLTSVKRDGHKLVGVVLGGKTAGVRDRIMADLIEDNIDKTATTRTVALLTEGSNEAVKAAAAVPMKPEPVRLETARAELTRSEAAETNARPEPIAKPMALAPMAVAVAAVAPIPAERPRPAFIAAAPKETEADRSPSGTARRAALDGSTGGRPAASPMAMSTTTPTSTPMRWITGPAPTRVAKVEGKIEGKTDTMPVAKVDLRATETRIARADVPKAEPEKPVAARSGVQIQIGATDAADKAQILLSRAKDISKRALASATPFTEKVQKGSETLWRARFAGLDSDHAEAACKDLKKSGFSCFTTKN